MIRWQSIFASEADGGIYYSLWFSGLSFSLVQLHTTFYPTPDRYRECAMRDWGVQRGQRVQFTLELLE